jgi:hypothetical protein
MRVPVRADTECFSRLWLIANCASPERAVWRHGLVGDRAISGLKRLHRSVALGRSPRPTCAGAAHKTPSLVHSEPRKATHG